MHERNSAAGAVPLTFVHGRAHANVALRARKDDPSPKKDPPALRELVELRRRDQRQQAALRQMHEELRRAARVQRDLHGTPPAIRGANVSIVHRPAGAVSGDLHKIARLDESHISIALADATGHDVAAGLLAAFVQQCFHAATTRYRRGTLVPPDEVLRGANDELIRARLRDCQFVTALYAVYDENSRVLRWARAGAPYPILIRRGCRPRPLPSAGPLLGGVDDAAFEVARLHLQSDDVVLLHTDGLEALFAEAPCGHNPPRSENSSSRGNGFSVCDSPWLRRIAALKRPDRLEGRSLWNSSPADWSARVQRALYRNGWAKRPEDDVTVIVLEIGSRSEARHGRPPRVTPGRLAPLGSR